jgi:hypothetical protein
MLFYKKMDVCYCLIVKKHSIFFFLNTKKHQINREKKASSISDIYINIQKVNVINNKQKSFTKTNINLLYLVN